MDNNDKSNLGGGDPCLLCCLPCLFCWGVCEESLKCALMTLCCCYCVTSEKVSDTNETFTEEKAIEQNNN